MTFDRRRLLVLAGAIAFAGPALADPLSADDQTLADKAVAYLQGLTNAKGRFRQTDWRGDIAEGAVYIARPGKARFEYDPPNGLLITCDGKTVTVTNSRLKTTHRYPMKATPLGLFLGPTIALGQKGAQVVSVAHVYDGFSIVAEDARSRTQGQIRLDFAEDPLRLTGWAVTDPQRRTSTVALQDFGPTGPQPDSLFVQDTDAG